MSDLNKLATEVEYKVCKICKNELKRFRGGRYPNGKDVKYLDQNNREWSGCTCPQCHSDRTAATAKAKRNKKRAKRKLYV